MQEPRPAPPATTPAAATDAQAILLALHHENSTQARHHDQQRLWIAAIVTVTAGIVLGLLPLSTGEPLHRRYALLLHAALLLAAGTFGFLASLHHHERARLHVQRVHALRRRISQTLAVDILDLYAEANREHLKRFPTLSNRTARVHYLWQGLHATVVLAGLALAALVLFVPGT
jgi:hypothetical protein